MTKCNTLLSGACQPSKYDFLFGIKVLASKWFKVVRQSKKLHRTVKCLKCKGESRSVDTIDTILEDRVPDRRCA